MKQERHENNLCFNCKHLFITHDRFRRWGCRNFGFKSKMIPALEVFASTGMKCAYKVQKNIRTGLINKMPVRRKK